MACSPEVVDEGNWIFVHSRGEPSRRISVAPTFSTSARGGSSTNPQDAMKRHAFRPVIESLDCRDNPGTSWGPAGPGGSPRFSFRPIFSRRRRLRFEGADHRDHSHDPLGRSHGIEPRRADLRLGGVQRTGSLRRQYSDHCRWATASLSPSPRPHRDPLRASGIGRRHSPP